MTFLRSVLLALVVTTPAAAETVVTARTVTPGEVFQLADLTIVEHDHPGAVRSVADILGREAQVTHFAGQPIYATDLSDPTLIERNQIVRIAYQTAGLTIVADARALDAGGVGAHVAVLNLSSRTTVQGVVQPDGSVLVGPGR